MAKPFSSLTCYAVATKSQNEVLVGEISLEKRHIDLYLADEISELPNLFDLIGIPPEKMELRNQLREHYRSDSSALLQIMVALEFGIIDKEMRSPVKAGLTSCGLFVLGALPSIVPFAFSGGQPIHGLIAAAVITSVALLVVGAVKTWATHGSCLTASIENLVIAGVGGAFAYGVGVLFDMAVK
jgi:VIT1/CCC1 family predicted Fe2+/Mn2+ transporter